MLQWTHVIRDIIGDSFAKHWCGQPGVNVLCVQVVILAVEHQRGRFAAQQVGERTPDHGEAEHRAVLRGRRGRGAGVNTAHRGQDGRNLISLLSYLVNCRAMSAFFRSFQIWNV